jgi:hypothetical protein
VLGERLDGVEHRAEDDRDLVRSLSDEVLPVEIFEGADP